MVGMLLKSVNLMFFTRIFWPLLILYILKFCLCLYPSYFIRNLGAGILWIKASFSYYTFLAIYLRMRENVREPLNGDIILTHILITYANRKKTKQKKNNKKRTNEYFINGKSFNFTNIFFSNIQRYKHGYSFSVFKSKYLCEVF